MTAAPNPAVREITSYPAILIDWTVRDLTPIVLATLGLTDDAADLAQLEEITPVTFAWPGLLEPARRILTAAGATLLEAFLTEHRHRPGVLPPTHDVLRDGLGQEVLDAADDARIAVLPHRIGQHAYYTLSVGVQLLHFRHGAHSQELERFRDMVQVSFLGLHAALAAVEQTAIARRWA